MVEWTIVESRKILAKIVDFAAEFSWLYDFHGTQVLDCGVLDSLPADWRNTLTALDAGQLNEIAECQSRPEYPQTMQRFLQSCSELSIHQLLPDVTDDPLPEWKVGGMSQKKRYEVMRLMRLVVEVQSQTRSQVVLDVGAGLGYVDSLLHHKLGIRVLAVESEPQRVLSARARHVQKCGKECSNLQYLLWKLNDDKDTVLKASAVVEQLVDPARANEVCSCLKNNDSVFRGCPVKQSGMPASRVPSFTSEMPSSASEMPSSTSKMPSFTSEIPSSTSEMPSSTSEMPSFASEMPSSASRVVSVSNESNTTSEQASIINKVTTSLAGTNVTGKGLDQPEVTPEIAASGLISCNPVHESVTLLGLHACADVSPTMIRMFMCCNKISSMILLSCCYHKLKPAKLEEFIQECSPEADPEPDAKMTRLTETSKAHECDACSQSQTLPKLRPSQRHFTPIHVNSTHVQTKLNCRRSSDPKCLFKNFPLSQSGSMLMCLRGFSLSVYGLRLACQEPGSRWRHMREAEHRTHENALLFRAVLDSVCAKHGVDLVKKKRRCANKEQLVSFESYLSSVLNCYDVNPSSTSQKSSSDSENDTHHKERSSSCPEPDSTVTRQDGSVESPSKRGTSFYSHTFNSLMDLNQTSKTLPFNASPNSPSKTSNTRFLNTSSVEVSLSGLAPALRQCYSQNQHLGPLLEAITGLQLAMQGVLESFVLLDRVLYALESKFCSSVQLVKVFDAAVSPRCVALVLYK